MSNLPDPAQVGDKNTAPTTTAADDLRTNASVANVGHGPLVGASKTATDGALWGVGDITGVLSGETVSAAYTTAAGGANRLGTAGLTWAAGEDFCEVWRTAGSSATALWKNSTSQTLNLSSGTVANMAPAAGSASWTDSVVFAGLEVTAPGTLAANFYAGVYTALLLCKAALTTAQREAITNAVNAL